VIFKPSQTRATSYGPTMSVCMSLAFPYDVSNPHNIGVTFNFIVDIHIFIISTVILIVIAIPTDIISIVTLLFLLLFLLAY
jgi:hypothetical protein